MPSFFIDRPIFAWVVALLICLGGLLAIPFLAGRAVSDHRAALDLDQHQLSGRLAGEPLQQRHAADRRGAERRDRHPQFRIDQRLARPGRDHRQLRARHRTPKSASVEVQNRIKRVEARLPRAVIQQGILIEEASSAVLQIITLQLDRRQPRRGRRSATSWCATCWARSAAFPASAAPRSIRPSARCGSGSIRASWSATTSPPTT